MNLLKYIPSPIQKNTQLFAFLFQDFAITASTVWGKNKDKMYP